MITKFSFGSLLLFVLFATHLLVGAVELGTDGWIQNITGNLFTSEQGKALFLWTSTIMFVLRFCAQWIERNLKLSPIGLLLACSILAVVGLRLASGMQSFVMALGALAVCAIGKTFVWPTMLAVASDRFPRSGAVAISIMGGIATLSAGLKGGPGLGYCKDRFAAESLQASNTAVYAEVKTKEPSEFLFFAPVNAVDGKKLAEAKEICAQSAASFAGEQREISGLADLTRSRGAGFPRRSGGKRPRSTGRGLLRGLGAQSARRARRPNVHVELARGDAAPAGWYSRGR